MMGKMKALLIEMEENGQQPQDDDLSIYEEAHYVHTINDFVSLIEVYGWTKVIEDLREQMGNRSWQ